MPLRLAERCTLWLYGGLMRLLQPFLLRKLRRRGQQEPGYLHQVPQRLGRYDTLAVLPGAVWMHAVSLGETHAAGLLIEALRQRWPGMRLVLTHSTATGWAQGKACCEWAMCRCGVRGTHRRPRGCFCNSTNPCSVCLWKPRSGRSWCKPANKPVCLCFWSMRG